MLPLRAIVQRSLGSPSRSLATAAAAKIQDVHSSQDSNALNVAWADGTQGSFPYIWLRDCAKKDSKSYLNDLSLTIRPENVGIKENGEKILIQWPPYCMVSYDSEWLRKNVEFLNVEGVDELKTARKEVQVWDASSFPTHNRMYMADLKENPAKAVEYLDQYGFVIISGVNDSPLDILQNSFNFQQASCDYNEVQDLAETRSIATHAVTSLDVPKYYAVLAEKPGKYGNFQMVDGFKVAKEFKTLYPEVFEFASQTPIAYCEGAGGEVVSRHPIITLDKEARIEKVVFNNDTRCSDKVPQKRYQLYYKAILHFHHLAYQQRSLVDLTLNQGDLLLLDNTRVLSGSTAHAFNPTRAKYHLGCYRV